MKKIIAILLLLCCLVPAFAACGKKDEVPDNMQEAAIETAPFHLYVPVSWILTTASGISGARVNSNTDTANVTVIAYYPETAMTPADYFTTVCLPAYTADLSNFARLEAQDGTTTLGGRDAARYVFTYTLDGKVYQVMQIIAAQGDMLYVLTYTALSTTYADHTEEVELIRANFAFR